MKKIALLLIAWLPLIVAHAQITHDENGATDRQAQALLKQAAAHFEQNVQFEVSADMLNSEQKSTLHQQATVRYHKGKYRLSVADQEIICDGTTVWQWNKTAREVSIQTVGTDEIDLLNPAHLLTHYASAFRAKYIRTENDGTALVDLQPRTPRAYHKIRLFIEEKSGLMRRMEVYRYDSSREIYVISHFKKATTPATDFAFNAAQHPEVEIIDMR